MKDIFLILFDGNLTHDHIFIMAKFQGKKKENFENILRSRDVLSFLRRHEFINFWYKLIEKIRGEIDVEIINDEISNDSFETIVKVINDEEILLSDMLNIYENNITNCIALVKDDNLLNILRNCSKLLIEDEYLTFYF